MPRFWNYKFSCLLLGKPQVQIHLGLWFQQWKSKSKWPKKEIAFFLTIAYLLLPKFGNKLGLQCENVISYQSNQFLQEHMWNVTDFLSFFLKILHMVFTLYVLFYVQHILYVMVHSMDCWVFKRGYKIKKIFALEIIEFWELM